MSNFNVAETMVTHVPYSIQVVIISNLKLPFHLSFKVLLFCNCNQFFFENAKATLMIGICMVKAIASIHGIPAL